MKKPYITIIIPIHNGENEVMNAIDSIYSQKITSDDFEVICIDDASTDETFRLLRSLQKSNLKIIHHSSSRGRGGACNHAVDVAKGEYILFCDHDDAFMPGSLRQVIALLISENSQGELLDLLMCDHVRSDDTTGRMYYTHNSSIKMKGTEFISTQKVPWTPWMYAYRRQFLIEQNIRSRENVSFDDTDYVLRCTVRAMAMKYEPICLYKYSVDCRPGQSVKVGNNIRKIEQLFMTCKAIQEEVVLYISQDKVVASALLGHYSYAYGMNILRYFWRISFSERKRLLKDYPAFFIGVPKRLQDWITWGAYKAPLLLALSCSLGIPLFKMVELVRKIIKN